MPDWSGVAPVKKEREAMTAKINTKAQGSQVLNKLRRLWPEVLMLVTFSLISSSTLWTSA
jgi:hypothetical protein